MRSPSKRLLGKPWIIVAGTILLLSIAAVLALRPFVSSKMESVLKEKAGQRGLTLSWKTSSWDPWRGQRFTMLRIGETSGTGTPLAEIEAINLRPSFGVYFGSDNGSLDCTIDSSPLVLRDKGGTIRVDKISASMTIREDEVEIGEMVIGRKGLTLDLEGTLLLPPNSDKPEVYHPDFRMFHSTFGVLDMEGEASSFSVKGDFNVDLRKSPVAWDTRLEGRGGDLLWKGVRWTGADAEGKLSSEGAEISYGLTTTNGSVEGKASRSGKSDNPFSFTGKISDSSGTSDEFRAKFSKGILTLESLEGSADLWELSKDVPAMKNERPKKIRFASFPHLKVKNLKAWEEDGHRKLTVGSISIESPDPVEFDLDGRMVEARDFSATGSHNGESWIVENSEAEMFGGTVGLTGSYKEGVLRNARIDIAGVNVKEVRRTFEGKTGKTSGRLTGHFKGTIAPGEKDWDGSGTMRMTDAPVVQVPLLDQAYALFISMVPGLEMETGGEFEADFDANPGKVRVTRFEAKGGKSLTVSAEGEIDLQKKRVQGRARGKLVGLPGLVTSPLSRLLEMEVSGPYDDIRVKPLGPAKLASATVSGTVGEAVETMEETGKVTGTVIKEGLKLPFKLLSGDDGKEEE